MVFHAPTDLTTVYLSGGSRGWLSQDYSHHISVKTLGATRESPPSLMFKDWSTGYTPRMHCPFRLVAPLYSWITFTLRYLHTEAGADMLSIAGYGPTAVPITWSGLGKDVKQPVQAVQAWPMPQLAMNSTIGSTSGACVGVAHCSKANGGRCDYPVRRASCA
jgi:hypothetical protein